MVIVLQDPSRLLKADRKLEGIWASSSIAAQIKLRQQEPKNPLSDENSGVSDDSASPTNCSSSTTTGGGNKVDLVSFLLALWYEKQPVGR